MAIKTEQPVVPTFQKGHMVNTDPENIIIQFLRFFFANPGNITDIATDDMVSMTKLKSLYGGAEPSEFANRISNVIAKSLQRIFQNTYIFNVDVGYTELNDGRYNLSITITSASSGNNVLVQSEVLAVDDATYQLKIS